MGTTAQKLQKILDTKEAIRQAINSKGVTVATGDTFASYPAAITGITSGGGSPVSGYTVRFIDYDGTILKEEIVESGNDATPPSIPTHDYLIFNSWNNIYTGVTQDILTGAIYDTINDKSYIEVLINSGTTGLSPILYLWKSEGSNMNINWGDSTSTDVSTSGDFNTTHTYSANGKYIITITYNYSYRMGNGTNGTQIFGSTVYKNILFKLFLSKYVLTVSAQCFYDYKSLLNISLSSNCTTIENSVFYGCSSLTNINIPYGVTTYGGSGFQTCKSLKSIVLPSTFTSFPTYCFYWCYSLKYINIPYGVTLIPTYMFYNCNSLEKIQLPSTVTRINDKAFQFCYGLSNVKLSNNITSIGNSSFQNCYPLTNLILPTGLTTIVDVAFYSCFNLKSISFPSTVTSIGGSSFYDCTSVYEYILNSSTPPTLGSGAFGNLLLTTKIYVPDANVNDYKTATNWSTYAAYIFPLSSR